MITYEDVKFYKSEHVDFGDDKKNGGLIGPDPIPSGEVNNILPEVTASEREDGVVKRIKVYIKNESDDRDMKDCFISISKDCDLPDNIKLYEATKLDHFQFVFDQDVNDGTAAGTHIKYRDNVPNEAETFSDIKGRTIKTNNQYLTVDDLDTDNNEIWFKEDTDGSITNGDMADTADDDNKYESDEDWDNMTYYINAPIIETLSNGEDKITVKKEDADNMAVGMNILIVNNYRRPMFRTQIDSINSDDNDDSIKHIVFKKPYSNATIPAMYGYVCSSPSVDIGSHKYAPIWLELNVVASNALEAELTNSFQLQLTFDDVAAE